VLLWYRPEKKCTKKPRHPSLPHQLEALGMSAAVAHILSAKSAPPPKKKGRNISDTFRGFMGVFGILKVVNLLFSICYLDRNTSINNYHKDSHVRDCRTQHYGIQLGKGGWWLGFFGHFFSLIPTIDETRKIHEAGRRSLF
jgi:hypothetical protein